MSNNGIQHGRILLVEDEGIVATDIERCLEDAGFEVVAIAASAEDAMREASRTRPDLVLMDVRIQGAVDGIEAGRQLFQRFKLPIIYLTAHGDRDTIERAKTTEPLAFLLKPFKPIELTRAVEFGLNRAQAEKQVREREQAFLSAMESIGDAVLTADAQGSVRFINRATEELTGWSQDQALGRPITEIVSIAPERTGASVEQFRTLLGLDGGAPARQDPSDPYCILARDGARHWVTARATRITQSDRSPICIAVLHDITKRQEAEQALRRQADLLDQCYEPIFTWDLLNGAIRYWNQGAERLYGYSRDEAVGAVVHELLRTVNPETVGFKSALERTGRWCGELTQTARDGREIIVESLMMSAEEPSGGRTVLVTNREITERIRAELEIRRLNAELEQRVRERTAQLADANKELEAFAYSVSHDLRAPLRGIDGWSLALAEDYACQLDQRGHEYLGRVRCEAQRMGLLIDGLLHLSRVGRVEIERSTVDLSRVAEMVAARLREAHPSRQIEFLIQPGLTAAGDARLLEVVLTNLLENAVKFTSTRAQARIEFGQTQQNGVCPFFVRDNGVGFDMAYASTLFGAFQRLHKASEFPGSGIGLATVQRVIHRHGGRVWVEAVPDLGATFYFTIGVTA